MTFDSELFLVAAGAIVMVFGALYARVGSSSDMDKKHHNHNHNHNHHEDKELVAEGELLVSGHGEITLDETLHPSRLLRNPTEAVVVRFGDHPKHTPCVPHHHHPDEVDFEVRTRQHPHRGHELCLFIRWRVSQPRKVIWQVYEVDRRHT